MSTDSHNHTLQNPNGNQTENEHSETTKAIVRADRNAVGSIMIDGALDKPEIVINLEPTEREILAAMVSELCAECIRVTGMGGVGVWFWWCASSGMVTVHAGYKGQDIHGVMNEYMWLGREDSTERLAGLIKRVAALGVEG